MSLSNNMWPRRHGFLIEIIIYTNLLANSEAVSKSAENTANGAAVDKATKKIFADAATVDQAGTQSSAGKTASEQADKPTSGDETTSNQDDKQDNANGAAIDQVDEQNTASVVSNAADKQKSSNNEAADEIGSNEEYSDDPYHPFGDDEVPVMIRRKRKRLFNQPQPPNFLRNGFDGYPAQYGNLNIGRSNNDGYKRALNYYRPIGAGPNQYGPNPPDSNYPRGLPGGNFQDRHGFPPQGNPGPYYPPGFNPRPGNYFPMRMPQSNWQSIQGYNGAGFLQKGSGVITNVLTNLKQPNSYPYQPILSNYPRFKANAANMKANTAHNIVNDSKHQVAYTNGRNQEEAVNEEELIREFQALLDKNMVPNLNGRITAAKNANVAGAYAINSQPNSGFGLQLQQRYPYHAVLKQQPPQNQFPPQNLNSLNLAIQQPFFQNPAAQNQYLFQQNQNLPQNQNYQKRQDINSQHQGFNPQNTNFYQHGFQQYPQFQLHPSNYMQKSLEVIKQNSNLFPPIVDREGQKLVPPDAKSEGKLTGKISQEHKPGHEHVKPQEKNSTPLSVRISDQGQVPFHPNAETQDQNQFLPNTVTTDQNPGPPNVETQDQNKFSPSLETPGLNQFLPNIVTTDQSPGLPNVETQSQNQFPPSLETPGLNQFLPNTVTQDQTPAPEYVEPKNQSPTPLLPEPQLQSPTPQVLESQVQHPASPNTETPTPGEPVNQQTTNNNNTINHATEAVDLDYGAIPGWLDQDFMPQTTSTSTEPEPETTEPPEPERELWSFEEAKKRMTEFQLGYFTVFVHDFFNIFMSKSMESMLALINAGQNIIKDLHKTGVFHKAPALLPAMQYGIDTLSRYEHENITAKAEEAARITANRKEELKKDLNAIFDRVDDAFTVEEGDLLLKTLERFENHTNGEENDVVKAMLIAILSPLLRGTPSERGSIAEMINKAIIERNYLPQMRRVHNQNKNVNEAKKKLDRNGKHNSLKYAKVFDMVKHIDEIIKKVEKDEEEVLNKYRFKSSQYMKETNKGENFERKDSKVMANNNNNNKKFVNRNSKTQHKLKEIERPIHIPKTKHKKYDRLQKNEYNYEHSLRNKYNIKEDLNIENGNKFRFDVIHTTEIEKKENEIANPEKTTHQINHANTENDDDIFDREIRSIKLESKEINHRKSGTGISKTLKGKSKHIVPIASRRNFNHTKDTSHTTVKKKLKNNKFKSIAKKLEDKFKNKLADAVRHFVFKNYRRKNNQAKLKEKYNEVSSYSDEEGEFKKNIYKAFGYDTDLKI